MNVRKNLIFWAALFFTAIPLSGNANPDFNRDGAVRDPASQSGWALPALDPDTSDHDNCLRCHQPGGPAADVSGYLKGGHKNMARPADGNAWGMPGVDATHPASSWLADAGLDPLTGLFEKLGIQEDYPQMFVNWSPRTISLAYCAKSDGTIGSDDVPDLVACPTCESPIMANGTAGYPLNYPNQTTCETARHPLTGTTDYLWVDEGDQPLYWIYGGAGLRRNPAVFERGSQVYSCARCHTTGWTANDINTDPDLDPDRAFDPNKLPYGNPAWSLATFTTMTTLGNPSQLLLDPGMPLWPADGTTATDTARNLSSWDQWGIECSRCHMSFYDGHSTWPNPSSAFNGSGITTGGDITALCMNCHRQENTGPGKNGVPLLLTNGSTTSDMGAKLLYTNRAAQPDGFSHHADGNEFLNSPHAKFKGNWGQIGCPPYSIVPGDPSFPGTPPRVNYPIVPTGEYCSRAIMNFNGTTTASLYFSKFARAVVVDLGQNTSTAGGCTSCHNVHETTNENSSGWSAGAFNATCTDCHSNPAATITVSQVNLSLMYHPTGPGTPMENPAKACSICHQPEGMKHLWRINTDPNYITFPTYTNSESLASTAVDTTGYNAVWVDLDHACGQCHGGGVSATDLATTGTIDTSPTGSKTLTVDDATGFAAGKKIHIADAGVSGGPFKTIISSVSGSTVNLSYAVVSSVAGAAVTVSGNPAAEGAPYLTGTQIAESAKTIHDGNVNSMTCSVCHTIGTGHHVTGTTSCSTCHTARLHTLVLPPSGNPSYNSEHVTPGTGCLGCHGPGGLATHNTITADGADDNHHSNAGSCTSCHGASGGEAPNNAGKSLAADRNDFCLTCHSNSGSYPVHHGVAAVATAGKDCMSMGCHAANAGAPGNALPATNANCLLCHNSAIGTAPAIVLGTNHHSGVNCAVCHLAEPFAVLPPAGNPEYNSSTGHITPGTGCLGCHGPGGLATHNTITADGAGDNHHSNQGACSTCHGAYGGEATNNAGKSLAADGNAFCLTCHSNTGSYPAHHGVAAVATAGKDCTDCHKTLIAGPGQAGVPGNPLAATNANCLLCHSSAIGTAIAIIPGTNHHGAGLQNCTTCHGASGGEAPNNGGKSLAADGNAFCLTCHSNGGSIPAHHAVPALKPAGKNCSACHNGGGVAPADNSNAACMQCHDQPWTRTDGVTSLATVSAGVNHHTGTCTTCHTEGAATMMWAVSPSDPGLNSDGTVTNTADGNTACMTCHSTAQGGKVAIVTSGAGDNHHGMTFGTPAETRAPCVSCHTGNGGVAFSGGNTLCLSCHQNYPTPNALVQEAQKGETPVPGANHHYGVCLSCHIPQQTNGSLGVTGPGILPVTSGCNACHTVGGPNGPGIQHHDTVQIAGCDQCHLSAGVRPTEHGTNILQTCTDCHTAALATINHPWSGLNCTSCHGTSAPTVPEGVCDKCHTLDAFGAGAVVVRFWQTIHQPIATAEFKFSYSTSVPKKVTFTNIGTNCSGPAWDFGDGSTGTGSSVDHIYDIVVSSATITMTCSEGASKSRTVSPRSLSAAAAPSVALNFSPAVTGYSIDLTDLTDYGVYSGGTGSIRISWGDGKYTTVPKGTTTMSHLYPRARKYTIVIYATLNPASGYFGQRLRTKISVTVERLIVSGIITKPGGTTPFSGVIMTLMHNGKILKKAVTNSYGMYTFRNVVPNHVLATYPTSTNYFDYTIEATKRTGKLISDGTTTIREVYTWTPSLITTTITNTSQSGKNFEALPLP